MNKRGTGADTKNYYITGLRSATDQHEALIKLKQWQDKFAECAPPGITLYGRKSR